MSYPVPDSVLREPRRILVRGVNWLGDAVMTTPALLRLRQRFPEAHIALTTPENLQDLWRQHSSIDEVIAMRAGQSAWSFANDLRSRARNPGSGRASSAPGAPFDLALVFPNSPRSALEVWLARIPVRVGYARPWRNWLLTHEVPDFPGHLRMHKLSAVEVRRLTDKPGVFPHPLPEPRPDSHHIHEYLHLAGAVGADPSPVTPSVEVTAQEVTAAEERLCALAQTPGQPRIWLGISPSAAYGPAKRWPVENFGAAARTISRHLPQVTWVLFGTKADEAVCGDIARQVGAHALNLAGQTSLRQLMALLKSCRILLTNDSGPMHLAAAVGTPVVALFGSTSPALTGPGLPGEQRHKLLQGQASCAPCFRAECPIDLRCLTGINVGSAVDAVLAILG